MCKVIEVLFAELDEKLPGLNYVVGLDVWTITPAQVTTIHDSISALLEAKVVIRSITNTTAAEAIADIEGCVGYAGDSGHGPDQTFLRSRRFKQIATRLKESLVRLASRCTQIASFSLFPDPYSPIMWGFKYLFLTPDGGVVLIGASWD